MKTIVLKNYLVLLMAVIKSKLKCTFLFSFVFTCYIRDASLNAEDMASQSVRLKEEQLRKEEEKV